MKRLCNMTQAMKARLRSVLKAEWIVVAVIVILLIAIIHPTPHWRETSSQSCHLCGNRRVVIHQYRWWRFDSEVVEPVVGAEFPVPEGHAHDWWEYGRSRVSYSSAWAGSNSSRYRDGRINWTNE